MFRDHSKSVRGVFVSVSTALAFAASSAVQAVSINFDTDAAGNPYTGLGDFFPAGEYAALGVTIKDSDPTVGSTYVNLTNPVNVGTSISGYYVNVGAFAGKLTFLDLQFTAPVSSVAFDFATPSGLLGVFAFGADGNVLAGAPFSGSDTFVNQAGFNMKAGQASLSGLGPISRVLVNPAINEGLIFDNLQFTPVPLPPAVWLFGSGLLGLVGIARRKAPRLVSGSLTEQIISVVQSPIPAKKRGARRTCREDGLTNDLRT